MITEFSINLSEKKYSETYFYNLKNNPSEYFMKLRRDIISKEIKNVFIQFNQEIKLCRAAQEKTLNVEISQRRGYKCITFYC